jgi:exopolyphosphatase/guanosine-5'-triphosphate,3'-diphosphate pyrophosphatase
VAEKDKNDGLVGPQIAEADLFPIGVRQGYVGEAGRVHGLQTSAMRVAVVDLGTNTTRVLVADVENGKVEELERRTTVTRLGEGVDASGRLSEIAIERVAKVLEDYRRVIDELEPERLVGLATSAVRDADNGDEFRQLLHDRFGIDVKIIPGEEEARLTFIGATAAREPGEGPLMVIDIGGGSTEFVVGRAREAPDFSVSTNAGSVRQTERHLHSDPPAPQELNDLRAEVRQIIAGAVPEDVRTTVEAGIAVAGTATSLAAIDQELDRYDPKRVHGYRLTLEACERMLGELAALPLEERRGVKGLHKDRAPTIVAGAAILVEAIRVFGLDSIEVSEADILHGAALDAAAGG